jgi:putative glycosyltransferase (TIGR04372 family)
MLTPSLQLQKIKEAPFLSRLRQLASYWRIFQPSNDPSKVPVHLVGTLFLSPISRPLVWIALFYWRNKVEFYYKVLLASHRLDPKGATAAAGEVGVLARLTCNKALLGAELLLLNRAQRHADVVRLVQRHPQRYDDHFAITPPKIDAYFHEGDFETTLRLIETTQIPTAALQITGALTLTSVAAACYKRWDLVHQLFAREWQLSLSEDTTEKFPTVWNDVLASTRRLVAQQEEQRDPSTALPSQSSPSEPEKKRVGIFYHNMPHLLGHALQEPYVFMALNRDKYDEFCLIGGLPEYFEPGPAAAMSIVNQYCKYTPTNDPLFHRLAHTDLGICSRPDMGLHAQHNWTLCREFVHRSTDPADPFVPYTWFMKLPPSIVQQGEEFCRRHRIEVKRPIVTLHVRDDGYHAIRRQGLRNAEVSTYAKAINWLLDHHYAVIRLGDPKMPRLEIDHPAFYELPFMEGYKAELDPFFVDRSRFMLSAPSGPLVYALALGVPMLCVNAIHNYLHFSSHREMECFKVYIERSSGRELSMQEALQRRLFFHIHKPELDRAGYDVRDATSDEILESVKDMEAWVTNSKLELSDRQTRFRETVDTIARILREDRNISPPIADFLGMSMPGFRISPTVAEMRGDF